MTPKLKKIIIVIVLLVISFFVYSNFIKKDSQPTELISGARGLTSTRNLAEIQVLGTQITQALIQIESLSLDREIFNNSIFRSLNDRSEPIGSEPIGRSNPFAPLGQNFSEQSSVTDSAEDDSLEEVQVQDTTDTETNI